MPDTPTHPGTEVELREDGFGEITHIFYPESNIEKAQLRHIPDEALVLGAGQEEWMWQLAEDVKDEDADLDGDFFFVRPRRETKWAQ